MQEGDIYKVKHIDAFPIYSGHLIEIAGAPYKRGYGECVTIKILTGPCSGEVITADTIVLEVPQYNRDYVIATLRSD